MPTIPYPEIPIPNHPRFEIDDTVFRVTYDFSTEIQRQVEELIYRVNVAQDEALRAALIDLGWTPPLSDWRAGNQ